MANIAEMEYTTAYIRWTRVGSKKIEPTYSSGVVILKKTKVMLVLTSPFALRKLFPDMDAEQVEENKELISSRVRLKITFRNGSSSSGFYLAGFSLNDNLAVMALPPDDSHQEVTIVQFSEVALQKKDEIWCLHNRSIMRITDGDKPVVRYVVLPASFTTARVSHPARTHSLLPDLNGLLEYWLPLVGLGSDGAPIFNAANQVVAIHSFEFQGFQFGIPTRIIKDFIKNVFQVPGNDMAEILGNIGN